MKEMEIKMVGIGEIRPYFNNPRDNSGAIEPTMQSIKRFTFTKPIIVDRDGVIIAGHTRYIAAFRLGMTEVPVIYSDLNEEQAKAFRIADNKLAEKSYFDDTKLIRELKELNVPEEMQAFFFEDMGQMLNTEFNYNTVTGNSSGSWNNEDTDDYIEEEDSEEEKDEDQPQTTKLYTRMKDEKGEYMYIMCPYCNNTEKVYL